MERSKRESRTSAFGRAALLAAALALGFSSVASAAPKIRLVYGKDWSRAGREVKKMLESAAFKTAAKGRYLVETVDESGEPSAGQNLGSLKLPVIFVISEQGNCFFVKENVPSSVTPEQMLKAVSMVDKRRLAAEKVPLDSADACGEFLEKMEKFVGGPKRVIARGFYDNVYEKLKKLDPEDKTGWRRHFTMGDGIDIVIKANKFREDKAFSQGDAFIRDEFAKSRRHLTREQQQALLMAKFALYREDSSRRDEMVKLLQGIAELGGEDTLWGTSAVGWLNIMGSPPLSVYWGWRQGDFKGSPFKTQIKYGVDSSFRNAGKYTISFIKESGVALKIDGLAIMSGDTEVAALKNPTVAGDTTSFEFDLKRAYRGKITSMIVRGSTDAAGGSSGKIKIRRHVLRPRKSS